MRGLIVVTALTIALSASPAAADTALRLPDPTGHRPVGANTLYLKDTSRTDPWVGSVNYRELMVSLFYPTTSSNGPKKQYMTPLESERYLERQNIPNLPLDVLSTVRTNAVVDARPAGRRHSLIVLSPGFTNSRATLGSLAEDLASHGYVVAVVDHTYENRATTFPDGRVTGCAACDVDDLPGFWERLVQNRAADMSFVLDELTAPHPKWRSGSGRGARLIDPSRIAMAATPRVARALSTPCSPTPGSGPGSTSTAAHTSRSRPRPSPALPVHGQHGLLQPRRPRSLRRLSAASRSR